MGGQPDMVAEQPRAAEREQGAIRTGAGCHGDARLVFPSAQRPAEDCVVMNRRLGPKLNLAHKSRPECDPDPHSRSAARKRPRERELVAPRSFSSEQALTLARRSASARSQLDRGFGPLCTANRCNLRVKLLWKKILHLLTLPIPNTTTYFPAYADAPPRRPP